MINVETNNKYIIVNISQLAMTYILNKYLAYETRKLKAKSKFISSVLIANKKHFVTKINSFESHIIFFY